MSYTWVDAEHEANVALQQLILTARGAWFKIIQTEEQRRVYAVACALCEADGKDAQSVSMGWPKTPAMIDAKGTIAFYGPIRPNWALYWTDAAAAIDAVHNASKTQEAA